METTLEKPKSEAQSSGALRRMLLSQEFVLLVITVLAFAYLGSQNDRFLTLRNMTREVRQLFEIAIMALPMTFIIITGGIDLSVGSIFGLCAIVLGFLWQDAGLPLELAIVLSLFVGGLCGFFNGLFIVRLGVPPLIMTLATLALFRGIAVGISEARSARGFPDWFFEIGRGEVLGMPYQVWILLVGIIITGIILARTTFGRALYAIGNNETAARFAGIPVDRVKLMIYTFSGFTAALAALVFVARISTTRSDMGSGIELDVIAAVVLGGTSIFGGAGSIFGTVLGFILIQALKNGLLLAGVPGDASIVAIGIILIVAILINTFVLSRFRTT